MNKKLIIIGIAVLFITVGLSGCNEIDKDTNNVIEQTHFTISGTITNNYAEDVDVDYSVVENSYEWTYWAPTIRVPAYEFKSYSCEVELGYDLYLLFSQWFYPDTDTEGCQMITENIEEPTGEDLTYYIEIKCNGEIEISQTEPELTMNIPPTVSIDASIKTGDAPLTVLFTSDASDGDGIVVGYYWDFKDGETSSEASPTHTFQRAGTYIVKLTVEDDMGATGENTIIIKANFLRPKIVDTCVVESVLDSFYVKGIIQNDAGIPISNIDIQIDFYDSANNFITTNREYKYNDLLGYYETFALVYPTRIYGGAKGFFYDYFTDISYYDHYVCSIVSFDKEENVQDRQNTDGLLMQEIDCGVPSFYSTWEKCYSIENIGSSVYHNVKLVGIFYDSNGNLINIESSETHTLYAGQKETFKIDFLSYSSDEFNPDDIADYEIILDYI